MKKFIVLPVLALILTLALATCSSPWSEEEKPAKIEISVGGAGSRYAAWPNTTASGIIPYLIHEITLTSSTGSTVTETLSAGVTSKTVTVAPDTWTVNVDAYYDGILFATAADTVTVTAGQTATATLNMAKAAGSPDFYVVPDAAEWAAACSAISSSTGDSVIIITGDFSLAGSSANTFGSASGIIVKIYAAGGSKQLSLSSSGYLLSLAAGQDVTLRDVKFTGLTSNSTVAVSVGPNAAFTMQGNAEVSGNTNTSPGNNGGGVFVQRGSFTMQDNAKVRDNHTDSTNSYGGGVSVRGATGVNAIFIMRDNASVSGNSSYQGGGVCVNDSSFAMHDNASVSGNSSYEGGGVYVSTNSTFTMDGNASVSGGNTSTTDGGGVWVSNGTVTMDGGTISGNNAVGNGGGVYVSAGSASINTTFTMSDGEISYNTAALGGGVCMNGASTATFTLNTPATTASIHDNTTNPTTTYQQVAKATTNSGTINGTASPPAIGW